MLVPFLLSVAAGLGTFFGGIIAILFLKISNTSTETDITNTLFARLLMASSGVMISIGIDLLIYEAIPKLGIIISIIFFTFGVLLIAILDKIIPHEDLYSEEKELLEAGNSCSSSKRIQRSSLIIFIGMALHNFPEGISVAFAASSNIQLGISLCLAILLHNVLEGVVVAIPIWFATKSAGKVLLLTFVNGMTEPLGVVIVAIFCYIFNIDDITQDNAWVQRSLASVSGAMMGISAIELIPNAVYWMRKTNKRASIKETLLSWFLIGMVIGCFILVFSELLLSKLN